MSILNYGLVNYGNTCYMNASIQALIKIPMFIDFLINTNTIKMILSKYRISNSDVECINKLDNSILYNFYKLYYNLSTNTEHNSSLGPLSFRNSLKKNCEFFDSSEQQDVQESLLIMLELMHEEISQRVSVPEPQNRLMQSCKTFWANNYSPIYDLFHGMYNESKTCTSCNKTTTTYTPNICLSLDIPKDTDDIEEIDYSDYLLIKSRNTSIKLTEEELTKMRDCLSEETKEKMNSLHISQHCKVKTYTITDCLNEYIKSKIIENVRCSECNVICDSQCKYTIRLMPKILIVHLKRFENDGTKITNKIKFEDILPMYNICDDDEEYGYKLYSVICHHGTSLDCGHYYSFGYSTTLKKWYKYNDETVRTSNLNNINNSEVYMLFYQQMAF